MLKKPSTVNGKTLSKSYSDLVTELVWKAAHADPTYDIERAKVVANICKIPITTIMKVVRHAQRTPKAVSWDVVSNKIIQ
jgi:hypothetical protein